MSDITRTVYLLRHAKSAWDTPVPDHDRPLSPRGDRAGVAMAEHFLANGIEPGLVLCSSARRTVETLDHLRPALPAHAPIVIDPDLYGASAGRMLTRLQQVEDDIASVLLIAHNPGTEYLALGLASTGDPAARERLHQGYPTAGLATLAFDGPWATLDEGRASLDAYVVPRDLGVR